MDTTSQDEKLALVETLVGPRGRMLSASKRGAPGQTIFWNANIYDSKALKVWYGDVNVTKQGESLQELADTLRERIYVTREMPFRFSEPAVKILDEAAMYGADLDYKTVVVFKPK